MLPSFLYVFLFTGEHRFMSLPYYGPKTIKTDASGNPTSDTLYFQIPPFSLLNEDSIPFGNDSLKGKIYIANFFFVTCPSICPKMATHLYDVQKDLKKYQDVHIVSITVNPEHDSPSVLKQYAKKVHADKNWHFLTGPRDSIYSLAFKGFFVSAMKDTLAPGGFLHSSMFILVDKKGHIRGYFDGTSTTDTKKLKDAVLVLLAEEQKALKKKNG